MAVRNASATVTFVPENTSARIRLPLTLAAILWVSAFVLFFIGLRLRIKPLLLVAALDALFALLVTAITVAGRKPH